MLITGGAGFIGSNLVHHLVQAGTHVRILDNFSTGYRTNLQGLGGKIELIDASLEDRDAVRAAVSDQKQVVHLAALGSVPRSFKDPHATHSVNATGFLNLLTACQEAGVQRLVYASSSSVYGDSPTLPKQEANTGQALSPYAATKAINEAYARTLGPAFGLTTIGLRFFNVFGPRQSAEGAYAAVIPRFMEAARSGKPLQIYGDGEQTRDFTYVDNVVRAILNSLEAAVEVGGSLICNIGCGERIALNEVAQIIANTAGTNPPIEHLPSGEGDIRHSLADISLARQAIGYDPLISVRQGLALTYDWFKKQE